MTDESMRPPEGQLLYDAMKRLGKSFRGVAAEIGMSDARVRNIINGYQAIGQGRRIEVSGPEDTVAKIALVLDVTPEQLEAAGREDAAWSLRSRLPDGPLPDWAGSDRSPSWRRIVVDGEEIKEWAEDPYTYRPPESILALYDTDSLAGELQARIDRAERELGRGYWNVNPDVRIGDYLDDAGESSGD